uniref:riboflavin kinase n=1 Tax=uncultured SAR11 cluster alpha proteobacterium H17925_45G17 TaxID=715038 RepID=E7CA53_9PROT|nr:FAD synthase [uncultured SAR11 cluster alpha proteobacterium H17925_45G17]
MVHGFGRGSKQLGFPTANMEIKWGDDESTLSEEEKAVYKFAKESPTGIYACYAVIEGPESCRGVHKVAMSMGWNPTFTDVKAKTIEPWILHDFSEDFYDCPLRLLVVAYVRDELKFEDFEQLKREIAADGDYCNEALDKPELAALRDDPFLHIEGAKL